MPPDNLCRMIDQSEAFRVFATFEGQTQSQAHIKPIHWYVGDVTLTSVYRERGVAATNQARMPAAVLHAAKARRRWR
jgi:hypothetical protein